MAKWLLMAQGVASLPHQLACSYNEIAIFCLSSIHENEMFPLCIYIEVMTVEWHTSFSSEMQFLPCPPWLHDKASLVDLTGSGRAFRSPGNCLYAGLHMEGVCVSRTVSDKINCWNNSRNIDFRLVYFLLLILFPFSYLPWVKAIILIFQILTGWIVLFLGFSG